MTRCITRSGIAAVCFVWVGCAAGAALESGLWEVLSKADIGGTAADSPLTRVCVSQQQAQDLALGLPKPDPRCVVSDVRTEGSRTSYAVECPGSPTMRGQAELLSTPGAFEGTMQMTMRASSDAPGVPMRITFAGRRVGDC